MVGLVRKAGPDLRVELREVSGWPAIVTLVGDQPTSVTEIETDGERIFSLWTVVNPDKLRAVLGAAM